MKTFIDYLKLKEMANYHPDEKKDGGKDSDPAVAVAKEALGHIIENRPELLIAFLNQYRNESDIKQILVKHKLDSFQDIRPKMNGHFNDKGLADRTGDEPEQIAHNSADGFNLR
jgi:hypothetical protein